MTRRALFVGVILLSLSPVTAHAHSHSTMMVQDQPAECCQEMAMAKSPKSPQVNLKEAGATEEPQLQERSKQDACDCCQKCKAAKSAIKSKEEEKAPEQSGCEDCCTRCGEPLKPAREQTPAEIIHKNPPPDIIEKGKQ